MILIRSQGKEIVVQYVQKEGEKFTTLDGQERDDG